MHTQKTFLWTAQTEPEVDEGGCTSLRQVCVVTNTESGLHRLSHQPRGVVPTHASTVTTTVTLSGTPFFL